MPSSRSARGKAGAEPVHYHWRWDSEAFVLGADSRGSLIQHVERLHQYVTASPEVSLKDLAYTINSELGTSPYRLAIVAASPDDLRMRLVSARERLADPRCVRIKEAGGTSGTYFFQEPLRGARLAFLFPGEGAQYPNMLADLCLHFPEVRAWFDLMDRAFQDHQRKYLPSQYIFPLPGAGSQGQDEAEAARLWQMDAAVEAVFTASQALVTLLSRLEIRPDAVVGHSSGEYSALLASGALQVESGEQLIQHIRDLNGVYEEASARNEIPRAVLLAVGAADTDLIAKVLDESAGALHLAVDNCPHQVILCGTEQAASRAAEALRRTGAVCETLPFDRAYHTPLFQPLSAPLEGFFRTLKLVAPKTALYSCATAGRCPEDPEEIRRLAAGQWARPVRFRETIEAMHQDGARVFVEVGPRGNLTAFVEDTLRGRRHLAMAANLPGRSGITQLNHLVALLAAHHVPMKLDHLYARRAPTRVALEPGGPRRDSEVGVLKLSLRLPTLQLAPHRTAASTLPRSSQLPSAPVENVSLASGTPRPSRVPTGKPGADVAATRTPAAQLSQSSPGSAVVETEAPYSRSVQAAPGPSGADESGARSQVMEEYFATMERFLAVQRELMKAYLDDARAGAGRVLAPELPATAAAPDVGTGVTQGPTPPAPQLVRDGTDVAAASSQPGPSAPETAVATAPPGQPAPNRLTPEAVRDMLLSLISERTGYPLDVLDVNLNLEADLGIDSIKRIEILGAFRRQTDAIAATDLEPLSRAQTLQQVIDFVTRRVAESAGPSARAGSRVDTGTSSAPTATSTERSSGQTTDLPFIRHVTAVTPGQEVVVLCEFDIDEDLFLRDHTLAGSISETDGTLIGLPVVPLTMSMEMLAEAASLLRPDKLVVGMKSVRAYRWIALEEPRLPLQVVARQGANADEVDVYMCEAYAGDDSKGQPAVPIIEGTVIFADAYPQAATAGPFPLEGERASKWPAGRMYDRTGMFHGPAFRLVTSMDRTGRDGAEATLVGVPSQGLFRSRPHPRLLIDPVLLDAMGQVVGYWTGDQFTNGLSVFPFRLERLHLYGPELPPGEAATCRVRVTFVDDQWIRSNIEVVRRDGTLLVEMVQWEDRRLDLPREHYDFRISPRDVLLSTPWFEAGGTPSGAGAFQVCLLRQAPGGVLEAHGMIWLRMLAYTVLNREERKAWKALTSVRRRIEWLMGRIAVKDAVRLLLRRHCGIALCPADIEIVADEHGRPGVRGLWLEQVGRVPVVSLAHTGDMAVAIASFAGDCEGVGIDVERVGRVTAEVERAAFTLEELRLLDAVGDTARREWSARLWCAKEAVSKALGRGMPEGPLGLVILELDKPTGAVKVRLSGELARVLAEAGDPIIARTARVEDVAIASCILRNGAGSDER